MPEGREKITLRQPGQPYRDPETNQRQTGEPTFHRVYAERFNRMGVERLGPFAFSTTAPVLFEVRQQRSIMACDPDWCVRLGWVSSDDEKVPELNITSVRPTTGRRRMLELLCLEDERSRG